MNNSNTENSGCLGLLFKLLGIGGGTAGLAQLPYHLRDDFLSAAEVSFYHVLRQTIGERAIVCPKVRLADIFFVSRPNENAGARNRIASKHVDFLLCDPATMRPLAGIELDDTSHARQDRQERDALVEKVFEAAGLPLVRFPAKRTYVLAEVAVKLAVVFEVGAHGGMAAAPTVVEVEETNTQETMTAAKPICPKCGIELVIRSGPRGKFYGCPNYPKCRMTSQVS